MYSQLEFTIARVSGLRFGYGDVSVKVKLPAILVRDNLKLNIHEIRTFMSVYHVGIGWLLRDGGRDMFL